MQESWALLTTLIAVLAISLLFLTRSELIEKEINLYCFVFGNISRHHGAGHLYG